MLRPSIVLIGSLLLLGACTQKVVCPAYQSAFIYDKEALRQKYSYFKEDGTPKLASVSKTKYLVAEPTTYNKKTRSLATVEVKPIMPVVPDSLLMGDSAAIALDLDRAARSVIDSTYIVDIDVPSDSVATDQEYVISIDREVRVLKHAYPDSIALNETTGRYERVYVAGVPAKPQYHIKEVGFNVEQGNYLWYLRDVLVLPDVRLAKMQAEEKEAEAKKKKGIKGFFGNLFKKKKKVEEEQDVPEQKYSPDQDEYNFDEFDDRPADSTAIAEPIKTKKKFSPFGKKKKSPKPAKTTKPKTEKDPAAKEDDDDDGFN
jgi:hypothetical protein